MSNDESRPKAKKPRAPPSHDSEDHTLDVRNTSRHRASSLDPARNASGAWRKPGVFPRGAGLVLAVVAIAVVVAFARTERSPEAPVTPPPAAAPPATPERVPAQAPPPAAAAPQPAQKPAWPADFLEAFQEYAGKPGSKAMAMALDGAGRMAWIGVFERATQSEANDEALSQCMRHKAQSAVQENCRLYAVGDEIVW